MAEATQDAAKAEALVPKFQYEKTLNQDQAGRRTALYGTIDDKPALLILERAPFPTSTGYLSKAAANLQTIQNLGNNDVYFWYLAHGGLSEKSSAGSGSGKEDSSSTADLKINLIWPCTPQHVKKYSRQGVRFVTETPTVYRERVRPFVQAQRDAGRLDWVFNIIEGRKEVDSVLFRTPYQPEQINNEGFLLTPDLNWDGRTVEALHLLALVERRDLWSLRDLRKRDVVWLRHMRAELVAATTKAFPGLESDLLKLYVHYQPTYYHFHVHIVHVQLEAGATQAVGKAVGLDALIEQLEHMEGGPDVGMDSVTLSYTLGEASELYTAVFGPLKAEAEAKAGEEKAETEKK